MRISQKQIQQTVRAVLTGADATGRPVTRNDLSGASQRELVYVAVALLLAQGQKYGLVTQEQGRACLHGTYRRIMETLVVTGIKHNSMVTSRQLVTASNFLKLHHTEAKQLVFMPPYWLSYLVAEHGHNPAVATFYAAAQEADRLTKLPPPSDIAGAGTPTQQANRIYAWLRELPQEVFDELSINFQQW